MKRTLKKKMKDQNRQIESSAIEDDNQIKQI